MAQARKARRMLRSDSPVTLSLPPFRGVTRRLVLASGAVFLLFLVLRAFSLTVQGVMVLEPALLLRGMVWLPFSYSFAPLPLLSEIFALLSLWIFGATLEDELGSRWMLEFFFASTAGGGLLACIASYALASAMPALDPTRYAYGMWPASLALLLAFAHFHAEQELRLYFVLRIKAKFLAILFVLFYLMGSLLGGDRFGAMTAVCVGLAAWLYLRFAPRRGIALASSESWFGLRNAYETAKRRRAAKKFVVYMKKQGKDVNIDPSGQYVDPDKPSRDTNNKRWMN
jgi:membrane associated rhomboid family serine protease